MTGLSYAKILKRSIPGKVAVLTKDFPDVQTDKMLVDAATMRMVLKPASLDVMVATNLHADILSNLAVAVADQAPGCLLGEFHSECGGHHACSTHPKGFCSFRLADPGILRLVKQPIIA